MNNAFKMLKRNNIIYNYFLRKKILGVRGNLSDEEILERIIAIAKFSYLNHSGYYYDGRLENILIDYGSNLGEYVHNQKLEIDIDCNFKNKTNYTTIHVATELYEVGGHTRVLYQFLKRHQDDNPILVLTCQNVENVPEWFIKGLGDKITIITLNSIKSMFERAYVLRHIATLCETIILYHHPYDVVPIMAFSIDKCPPVLLENHAHSWFWLGPSIADLVFAHSYFHKEFTLRKRPVKNVCYLQCIQTDDLVVEFNPNDKIEAKKRLHLKDDIVCLITIGTSGKFIPNSQYNFYKTANKILERFKNVELFVIGISENAYIRNKYHLDTDRFHLVGVVSNPTNYYLAADICLDALPEPSIGATLNAATVGMACPLFKYGAKNIFNTRKFAEFQLYDKYIGDTRNEEEYLNKLDFLINNSNCRIEIAKEIRENYILTHSNDAFINNVREMLELSKKIKHLSRKIPEGFYHYDSDSAEIADNSLLKDLCSIFAFFDNYLNLTDKLAIIERLSVEFKYWIDILRFVRTFSKNKIKRLIAFCSG